MNLNGWEEDREIMQNWRERKQEGIINQLPSTPEAEESAISIKGNLDLQDRDLVRDQNESTNGREMVEVRYDFRNIYKVWIWRFRMTGGGENEGIPPVRKCRF